MRLDFMKMILSMVTGFFRKFVLEPDKKMGIKMYERDKAQFKKRV